MSALVLAKDYEDMASKYNLFTEKAQAFIQDEEKYYQQKNEKYAEMQNTAFTEMFGSTASDMEDLFEDHIVQQSIETEKLEVEKEDPFQTKIFEERKVVFTKPIRDNVKEAEVINRSSSSRTQSTTYQNSTHVYDGGSAQRSTTTSYQHTSSATTAANKEAPSIFEHVMRISKNVENVAYKTKPFEENKNQNPWGARKPTFWERCKAFFSSQKFRVMAKLGAMLSLQLFMAKLAGKYDIKNGAQFIGVIGLMLGSFYMSKELQSEGFDMRGFDI